MFYLHVIFCKIYSFTNHKCRSSIISSVHYKCFSFSKHIVLIITINQVALASKGWYDFPLGLISSNKIACGAVTDTIPIPLVLALLLSLTSGVLFIYITNNGYIIFFILFSYQNLSFYNHIPLIVFTTVMDRISVSFLLSLCLSSLSCVRSE